MIHQRVDVLEWTQTETGTMNGAVSTLPLRHLLITFANSLNPDPARQNFGHDLDPNYLRHSDGIPEIFFSKKF